MTFMCLDNSCYNPITLEYTWSYTRKNSFSKRSPTVVFLSKQQLNSKLTIISLEICIKPLTASIAALITDFEVSTTIF